MALTFTATAAPVEAVPAGRQSLTPAAAGALAPGTIVNVAGSPGWGPSPATDTVVQPFSITRWGTTLYVADSTAFVVRAVDLRSGSQRVIAGSGHQGVTGDGGPATAASFNGVGHLAVDATGALYMAEPRPYDPSSNTQAWVVRRIGSDGILTTVAGVPPAADITAIAVAADGAVLVADYRGFIHRVADGTSTIIAGTDAPDPGNPTGDGGPATAASLKGMWGLTVAPDGDVWVSAGQPLRRIDRDGIIHDVAAVMGALDHKSDGQIIATDYNQVVLVGADGTVTPIASTTTGYGGFGTMQAATADAEDRLLVAGYEPNPHSSSALIKRFEPGGGVTLVAGTGTTMGGTGGPAGLSQFRADAIAPLPDGSVALLSPEGIWKLTRSGALILLASRRAVVAPVEPDGEGGMNGLTADPRGRLYTAVGSFVRRIDPTGSITTVADDRASDITPTDGTSLVHVSAINDLAAGPDGELYLADAFHGVIRRAAPDGTITTIAGTRSEGFVAGRPPQSGDGGPATAATLTYPSTLAVDHGGNLYFVDVVTDAKSDQTSAVRRIGTDGTITRVMATRPKSPIGALAFDSADNLLFSTTPGPTDAFEPFQCTCQVLRRKAHGVVEVVAGRAEAGPVTSTGDGGRALDATFLARAIAVDAADNLYLVDLGGTRIREVTSIGAPTDIVVAPPAAPVIAPGSFTG